VLRHPIYLTAVLAMALGARAHGGPIDPCLVGWWTFEEGSGTTTHDQSGHGNDGVLVGSPAWVAGFHGQGLEFAGRDWVDCGKGTSLNICGDITLAAFVQVNRFSSDDEGLITKGEDGLSWALQVAGDRTLRFVATKSNVVWNSLDTIAPHEWVHVAATYNGLTIRFYINGRPDPTPHPTAMTFDGVDEPVILGCDLSGPDGYFDGRMDDVRIYSRALSDSEIAAMVGPILQATNPTPIDGATEVTSPLLRWVPGQTAARNVVYLGSTPGSLQQVASLPGSEVLYYHWAGLVPGQRYYWRVDEVEFDGDTLTGRLWSFTTLGVNACSPQPQNGSACQPTELILRWTAGATAAFHRVYLGKDRTAVAVANSTWPEFLAAVQAPQTAYPLKGLVPEATYFWRIDEVELNGTVHKGPVWGFTTIPQIVPSDPDLVAWWTLDEGTGQVAVDWSGHGHHGMIHGGSWAVGRLGSAIELDGIAGFIEAPGHDVPIGGDVFSMAAWVRPAGLWQDQTVVGWGLEMPNQGNRLELQDQRLCHRFVRNDYQIQVGNVTGDWIHVALVHMGFGNRLFYLNGTSREGQYIGSITAPNVAATAVGIGAIAGSIPDRFFEGLIDDVRIYRRVLGPQEVAEMVHTDPLAAWDPKPGDWAYIDIASATTLTWSTGSGAIAHEVYFGIDPTTVDRATPSTAGVYKGRVTTTSYTPAQMLVADRTYYWRVDECQQDGTSHHGFLWRFTIARYQVVDNFEAYTAQSPDRIFQTWLDGTGYTDPPPGLPGNSTGSMVGHPEPPYVEETIVHSGRQSMPFYFDNTLTPFYSTIERRFGALQNWLTGSPATLTLYLYGDPTNRVLATDRLYVELQDGSGRTAAVTWGHDQTLLVRPVWTQWDIALSSFTGAGVDLRSVQAIRIGIGLKPGTTGGKGVVYLDDLRLLPAQ